MLRLPGAWTWDFWVVDDGTDYHLFFLFASRALQQEWRRHRRAAIGHAISADLRSWRQVEDALVAGDPPAPDDIATWTGCTLRDPAGGWRMFYTGASESDGELLQSICVATSPDLYTWTKDRGSPIVTADPRWYDTGGTWSEEAWRDPWVFPDPDGNGWRMLITARANDGADADDRGVIGQARSADLVTWEILPPLSSAGAGFAHLEVPQVAFLQGRWVLIFSCLAPEMSADRLREFGTGGIWYVPIDSPDGTVDIATARPLTDHSLYGGRLVRDRAGRDLLLAFRYFDPAGEFLGELADPIPVGWKADELVIFNGPVT